MIDQNDMFPEPMKTPLIESDFGDILRFAETLPDDARETIGILVGECRRLIAKEKILKRELGESK